jgi:hypothetical protein
MRRTSLLATIASALALALGACGGEKPKQDAPAAAAVTEYVGTLSGRDPKAPRPGGYFVAVAVDKSGGVVAYICDGTGNKQAFAGKLSGDKLDLKSVSGQATLTGTVAGTAVNGQIKLQGKTLGFKASRPEGIGGLYRFNSDGRTLTAVSLGGTKFKGEYSPTTNQLTGTFTLPDGQTKQTSGPLEGREAGAFNKYRVVVLDGGQWRGAPAVGATQIRGSRARAGISCDDC